ncbi:MAG: hypothetical protein K2N28_08735 [Muribaculaceae bacterium]|nr:hypothetical protein [Muribaculaceae bacterium]
MLLSSCGDLKNGFQTFIDDKVNEVLPQSEININGVWESKDNPLWPVIEFKGKSTVVVQAIFIPLASSYERDEEFIRIKTDSSDLLFEIISEDSIVGRGLTEGTWIKKK